ncbi:hypothetical protein C8J57DRAFT_1532564 [Mycena rebaudengoi]|nr:hypothetical protein C8J57DRAFT_1532564 [Mycena rebaudengoi]
MPHEHGHGFPLLESGEPLGTDARYTIFVYDKEAISPSRGHCTQKGSSKLSPAYPPLSMCLQLKDSFTIPGKGSAASHLCLVTSLLAGDLRSAWGPHLPLPLAKRVLFHALRGLAHSHRSGVTEGSALLKIIDGEKPNSRPPTMDDVLWHYVNNYLGRYIPQ